MTAVTPGWRKCGSSRRHGAGCTGISIWSVGRNVYEKLALQIDPRGTLAGFALPLFPREVGSAGYPRPLQWGFTLAPRPSAERVPASGGRLSGQGRTPPRTNRSADRRSGGVCLKMASSSESGALIRALRLLTFPTAFLLFSVSTPAQIIVEESDVPRFHLPALAEAVGDVRAATRNAGGFRRNRPAQPSAHGIIRMKNAPLRGNDPFARQSTKDLYRPYGAA